MLNFMGKVLNPQHFIHIKGGVKEDTHRRQYQTGTLLRRISEGTTRELAWEPVEVGCFW